MHVVFHFYFISLIIKFQHGIKVIGLGGLCDSNEIHRFGQIIPKLCANREVHAKELIERGLKLEVDLRATEPQRIEVIQLRANAQKLNASRQDLSVQVQGHTHDVARLQAENQQLIATRADIDRMRKEAIEAWRAFEYEKKTNEEQLEQKWNKHMW